MYVKQHPPWDRGRSSFSQFLGLISQRGKVGNSLEREGTEHLARQIKFNSAVIKTFFHDPDSCEPDLDSVPRSSVCLSGQVPIRLRCSLPTLTNELLDYD